MTLSGGTDGEIKYLRPNSVKEYILLHVPKINARRFVIMATEDTVFIRASFDEREWPWLVG